MKKNILNSILIVVWFGVIFTILLCINKKPTTMYQCRKDIQIKQVNEYLYIEEDCSKEELEQAQSLLGYVPTSLFEDFRSENGKVILVSNLKDNCIGSTEINEKGITIYIKRDYAFDALLHEFGHVYLHFHPMEEDFKELYKTEAKSLVKSYYGDCPYYYSDEIEYFAQSFQTVLIMRGYDTQDAAPKTFSYMIDLIKELYIE